METSIGVLPKNLRYKNSANSFEIIKKQIKERYGAEEAERYTPDLCRTFLDWSKINYRVKRGEKALKSTTFIPLKNAEGVELRSIPKTCNLFYILQVEEVK